VIEKENSKIAQKQKKKGKKERKEKAT